jgi:hypothetical protein
LRRWLPGLQSPSSCGRIRRSRASCLRPSVKRCSTPSPPAGGTTTLHDTRTVGVEKWIIARIAKHIGNPAFVELGQRLNALREKYAHAQQASLEFLKELFELARDTVAAEKAAAEIPGEERGRAALTELFESLKEDETPIIIENVVTEVDEVVRAVRFDGWQNTRDGDRLVQRELRKTSTSSSRSATTASSSARSGTSGSTTDDVAQPDPCGRPHLPAVCVVAVRGLGTPSGHRGW